MKRIIWILLTVVWVAFIFFNSLRTGTQSSSTSGVLVNLAQNILSVFNIFIRTDILSVIIRKSAHFFEFTILAVFTYNVINKIQICKDKKPFYGKVNIFSYIIVLGFCLLIAITDEIIQYFVPGRANSIVDVLIDFSGSVFALLIVVLINIKKIKSTLNKH